MRDWAERLTDAFYWAGAGDSPDAPDISTLDHVGGCFETVAEGLLLVRNAQQQRRGGLETSLSLLAEAQSALRRSLQRLKSSEDPDQLVAYEAVREMAARRRIFLKRFLRADDLADPEAWPGVLARIEARSGGEPSQRHERQLDRLRSLIRALGEGGDAGASWRSVIEAVEQAVGEGVPPSSREIRGLLLPHLDDLPEGADLPGGFRRVLRAIDRYLATRPTAAAPAAAQQPTAEVREAARLLSGRSVVLIGGLRRPQAQAVLRAALGLEELVWIGTREHQSVRGFEAAIARPEVAVVLLAIRWSSHAFGDVKAFCDRHGKPLVRLPGGYNPAQVAAQVLAQCGERLRER